MDGHTPGQLYRRVGGGGRGHAGSSMPVNISLPHMGVVWLTGSSTPPFTRVCEAYQHIASAHIGRLSASAFVAWSQSKQRKSGQKLDKIWVDIFYLTN